MKNPNPTSKEAVRLNNLFQAFQSRRSKWIDRANENYAITLNDVEGTGTQFTAQQVQEIKDKGLIRTSINITIAIVEVLQAFLTSTEPSPNVYPIGESSKEFAYFYRECILWCLRENKFSSDLLEKLVIDQVVAGRGVVYARPSSVYDLNEFNIVLEYLPYSYYFPDPRSRRKDHQDSECIFIATPISRKRAMEIYGLTEEETYWATDELSGVKPQIPDLDNTSLLTGFEKEETIWIHEVFEKVPATLNILEDGTKTFKSVTQTVGPDGKMVWICGGVPCAPLKDSIQAAFIKRTLKLGNYIKSSDILPITLYPFGIYSHTHVSTPFEYPLVHNFIDLVYGINRFVALCVENAQVSSNSGDIAPKGAIDDHEAYSVQRSKPGGVTEYNADPSLPNGGAPVQRQNTPLNNAFYSLYKELIAMVEYVTGILPLLQGNASQAPLTEGATNTITSFGMQRPKMYARRIDSANDVLGRIIIEMFQAFAPERAVLRYIDGTSAMTEIKANVMLQKQQTEQGEVYNESYPGELASIIDKESEEKAKIIFGDFRQGKYSVYFKSTSGLPSTRAMAMDFLKTLLGRMSNDAMSIAVAEALFKVADMPEADQILRKVDSIQQMSQQIQQKDEQLKQLDSEIQSLQSKLESEIMARKEAEIDADIAKKAAKVDLEIDKVKSNIKEIKKKEVQHA